MKVLPNSTNASYRCRRCGRLHTPASLGVTAAWLLWVCISCKKAQWEQRAEPITPQQIARISANMQRGWEAGAAWARFSSSLAKVATALDQMPQPAPPATSWWRRQVDQLANRLGLRRRRHA